ncbi:ABC transporter permease [Actinoplanes sp. G11-F43]|uniref:ABC transporter permease n=1 Tax=Actinoplanes sp. G11-F43 TaxID=3424130 RepID=UPI003D331C59
MSTVALITARGLFGRRRALLLLPLPLLLVGLAAITRAYGVSPDMWGRAVIVELGLHVVLPVVALIVGTGVLGSEIDDGTIVHILTKPLPRRDIILAKYAVAASVTAVVSAIPLFITGLLAGSVKLGLALVAAAVVGALAYSALFLLFSLLSRRPVLLGLVYILVWENLLATFVSGTKILSVGQYVATIADTIAPSEIIPSSIGLTTALVMSAVFVIAGTVLAINRLGSFSLAGETS